MRHSKWAKAWALAGTAAGVAVLMTVPASAGRAGVRSTTTGFVVVSVAYVPSAVAVDGLATAPVTVRLHLTDSPPLPTDPGYLSLLLERSVGTGWETSLSGGADLVSGDGSDGVWEATISVPSGADGTWSLTHVFEAGMPGPDHPVVGAPTFSVTGTHQPWISAGTDPALVPYGTGPFVVKGRVFDRQTGAGIGAVQVSYGLDNQCAEAAGYTASTVTNAQGYYSFPAQTALYAKLSLNCVVLKSGTVFLAVRALWVQLQAFVSAVPAQWSVPVGTVVQIDGRVGSAYCPLELQRLFGSTAWRTEATSRVRASGRYTVYAHPSTRGANIYRILLRACPPWAPASSSRFVINAT